MVADETLEQNTLEIALHMFIISLVKLHMLISLVKLISVLVPSLNLRTSPLEVEHTAWTLVAALPALPDSGNPAVITEHPYSQKEGPKKFTPGAGTRFFLSTCISEKLVGTWHLLL